MLQAADPVAQATGLNTLSIRAAMNRFDSPRCVIGVILGDHNSYQTRRAYLCDLIAFGTWLRNRGRYWRKVSTNDLTQYRGWLARRYAQSTVNRRLVTVRSVYAEARRFGVMPTDPAAGLAGVRRASRQRETVRPHL